MQSRSDKSKQITLKTVANHVGLTPGTVSSVLNNTPGAARIPQATKDRIVTAARELKYQPNPLARALRKGHTTSGSFASERRRGAFVILNAENFVLAMTAIQQAGLRVPDDVSVVEFDGASAPMEYTA